MRLRLVVVTVFSLLALALISCNDDASSNDIDVAIGTEGIATDLSPTDQSTDVANGGDGVAPECDAPELLWEKVYGGPESEEIGGIVQLDDGYALGGSLGIDVPNGMDDDFWLIKTDLEGEIVWDKQFGGDGNEEATALAQTSDGGFVLAGYTGSKGAGGMDIWIIRTDTSGTLLWDKTFGGEGNDYAFAIDVKPNGELVVLGHTESKGAGATDLWLIVTDSTGNLLWEKTYGTEIEERGSALALLKSGGFALAGTAYTEEDKTQAWLLRVDDKGELLWDSLYGLNGNDFVRAVLLTKDDEIILAGGSESETTGLDFWLFKTDKNGSVVWDQTYGTDDDDYALGITIHPDGGYVLAGISGSLSDGLSDALIIRTDSTGEPIWESSYGGEQPDGLGPLVVNPDGSIVAFGATASIGAGWWDFWLVKLEPDCGD